jgi:hypothetical protein
MSDEYKLPRSPALRALHARYIGDDPARQADYLQAVEDADEVQEVARERDEAIAERDAAQAELAEARRLLAMATAFDAGPLLPGASYHWTTGPLRDADDSDRVTVGSWAGVPGWYVEIDGTRKVLGTDGNWIANGLDATTTDYLFPSPAAALAALDAWRAARRAEIESAAQQQEPAEPTP